MARSCYDWLQTRQDLISGINPVQLSCGLLSLEESFRWLMLYRREIERQTGKYNQEKDTEGVRMMWLAGSSRAWKVAGIYKTDSRREFGTYLVRGK